MDFTTAELTALSYVISEPRFGTYLAAAEGDERKALDLYCWNLRISSALLVPLHLCEVSVRNGVADAIAIVHGDQWPWAEGFIRSLPAPTSRWRYNPQSDLRKKARKHPTPGKIIADLPLAFWEQMFTARQDKRLWNDHLHKVFPGFASTISPQEGRRKMAEDIATVRALRNRVAHYEPIFRRRIGEDYEVMKSILFRRSPIVAEWLDTVEAVKPLLI